MPKNTSQPSILAVDCDGTLVRNDVLWESCVKLVCTNPLNLLRLFWWLLRGRIGFKYAIHEHMPVDASLLPYNEDVLAYLKQQKAQGRTLVLASASPLPLVRSVAEHLGVFDRVLATEPGHNLKSRAKKEAIRQAFPGQPYEYLGNEHADFKVWDGAACAGVVSPSVRFFTTVQRMVPMARHFKCEPVLPQLSRLMRMHQWVKNVLLFVPYLLSHPPVLSLSMLGRLIVAFIGMGLCASSVYIYNDLCDMGSDRRHPDKRSRPIARGSVRVPQAIAVALICLAGGIGLSYAVVSPVFGLVAAAYVLFVVVYTLAIKKVVLLDVLGLSFLYVYRLLAGGVAANVAVSQWLVTCSAFFFLNLAFVKRYVELVQLKSRNHSVTHGRGYTVADGEIIRAAGLAAGFLSVLVFYLYIANSTAVLQLYARPALLWAVGPFLLYWITRVWILANRGAVHSDPVEFALKDPVSWGVGAVVVVIVIAGSVKGLF